MKVSEMPTLTEVIDRLMLDPDFRAAWLADEDVDEVEHLYCCDPAQAWCGVSLDPDEAGATWNGTDVVCPLCVLAAKATVYCARCS